jgi:hypothetical protein
MGGGVAALLALGAYVNAYDPMQRAGAEMTRAAIAELERTGGHPSDLQTLREELSRFERLALLGHVLLVGAVLGLAGGLLAFFRLGKVAAPMLIVPAVVAGVLVLKTLIFTAVLIVAGVLALLIRSRPRMAPVA